MNEFELRSARWLAAEYLKQAIRPGDQVVDATMGNGHDTCFLAELVGQEGHVYAFDIQEGAILNTRNRLLEAGMENRCTLFHLGHEHMSEKVSFPIKAVVFNLGWLPGGDKSVTTLWDSTGPAIRQALDLLSPLGICSICAYPGHAAGDEERFQLTEYLSSLAPQQFNVLHHRFLNAGPGAPELFLVQKMKT